MVDLNIRQVQPADLDQCFTIESLCYTTDGASREKIAKRIETFPAGFLVAEQNGRIIGFINSGSTSKEDITDEALKDMVGHEPDGRFIVIFSVAVHPEYQGRGFSKPLLERFIEAARLLKKEKILFICKADLIPYYQKLGFTYSRPSQSSHGGFSWHEMYMAL
jgi:ribosomal protein S18 acetylase RimI-like enzyme